MHSWEGDPQQLATPDFGKASQRDRSIDPKAGGWRILLAIIAGLLLAVPFAASAGRGIVAQMAQWLMPHEIPKPSAPPTFSPKEIEMLDHLEPQEQAELLLDRANGRDAAAIDQITARVDGWRGKVRLTQKLKTELKAGFDCDDLSVRAAAVEVDLAALGLEKTRKTMNRLAAKASSGPPSQRIWAEWEMALLGSRGVEKERVLILLTVQTQDPSSEVRRWAVAGLAYLRTDSTIALLLKILHDDPSPQVREEAARGLAQSGMFTREQRLSAVPKLLEYAADRSLDTPTHNFMFHVLRDITGQNLPNDAASWRNWYNNRS